MHIILRRTHARVHFIELKSGPQDLWIIPCASGVECVVCISLRQNRKSFEVYSQETTSAASAYIGL